MKSNARRRIAEEAARFMAMGIESEYLQAKERAAMMLGLSDCDNLPSNQMVRDLITRFARNEIGDLELDRRLKAMRELALAVMSAIKAFDLVLFGSVQSGQIGLESDIDLAAYADEHLHVLQALSQYGYDPDQIEEVENIKGRFVHIRWQQDQWPLEITVYPEFQKDMVQYSSIDGKPIKKLNIAQLRHLIEQGRDKN